MNQPVDPPKDDQNFVLHRPHRVSLQSNDLEETQSFLSSLFNSVTVKPKNKELFAFEATMVIFGGVYSGTASSHSGIEMMFNEPFDGYGMSLLNTGILSVGTATLGQLVSPANTGVIVDLQSVSEATFRPQSSEGQDKNAT